MPQPRASGSRAQSWVALTAPGGRSTTRQPPIAPAVQYGGDRLRSGPRRARRSRQSSRTRRGGCAQSCCPRRLRSLRCWPLSIVRFAWASHPWFDPQMARSEAAELLPPSEPGSALVALPYSRRQRIVVVDDEVLHAELARAKEEAQNPQEPESLAEKLRNSSITGPNGYQRRSAFSIPPTRLPRPSPHCGRTGSGFCSSATRKLRRLTCRSATHVKRSSTSGIRRRQRSTTRLPTSTVKHSSTSSLRPFCC